MEICVICYDASNIVIKSHCYHFYCKKCIQKHIYYYGYICPICRRQLLDCYRFNCHFCSKIRCLPRTCFPLSTRSIYILVRIFTICSAILIVLLIYFITKLTIKTYNYY